MLKDLESMSTLAAELEDEVLQTLFHFCEEKIPSIDANKIK